MIVRDEEPWIARSLLSVREAVDEMIVVDTGSHDRTMDIAHDLGAKVLQFPWTESFAEARNYSLRHATGDWLLWMDADEEIALADAPKLREVRSIRNSRLASLETIHFNSAFRPKPHEAYRLSQCRLFRNGEGFHFTGGIHEQLSLSGLHDGKDSDTPFLLPLRLFHYGYLQSVTSIKSKHGRNLKLLQQSIADEPNPDPWSLYHIAGEYQRIGDYANAFRQVNLAIAASLGQRKLPPSLFYKLKYGCLLAAGSFREGWPGIDKATSLYPDYVDLHLYKGCILMHIGQVEAAISAFEHCLSLGENALHHMVLRGAGTFYPCYYLGNCYEMLGEPGDAAAWYSRALEYSPALAEAAAKLSHLREGMQVTDGHPSGNRCASDHPLPGKTCPSFATVERNKWSVVVLISSEDGPRSALNKWVQKWKLLADEWIVIDAGMGKDARGLAEELEAQILHFTNGEGPFQFWDKIQEVLTTPYVLWLHPYDEVCGEDLDALGSLKQSLISSKTMISFNLCLQAEGIDQQHWMVQRNRLAHRETVLSCNPISGEFVAVPGSMNEISSVIVQNRPLSIR